MFKVLVIDDSAFTLRTHKELLEAAGAVSLCAKGGEDGIRFFEEHRPEIVLCDIMMPDIDGYEVLSVLKQIEPDTFFYFVSSEMTESIVEKAQSLGAKGVLEKPLNIDSIRHIIQEYAVSKA